MTQFKSYTLCDDSSKMILEDIYHMLSNTYWAEKRTIVTIKKSMEKSICFGIFKDQKQVGFARVVTDYATMYWLCDVIVDEGHRGHGLGTKLVEMIVNDPRLKDLSGILATKDAHHLYKKFDFILVNDKYMRKLVK